MNKATPDQMKIVRFRRGVFLFLGIAIVALWLAPPLILPKYFTLSATTQAVLHVWFRIGLFVGFIILLIYQDVYWRCPVCQKPFTKASTSAHCKYCDTQFTA